MKSIISIILLLVICNGAYSQNNIGIGTQTPHASALLDVSSTSKGILAPLMTSTLRSNIASPAQGLWVFDTDT